VAFGLEGSQSASRKVGRNMGKAPYTSGTRERLIERLRRQSIAMANGHRREDSLLTTGEVAMLFRVSHRAVRCWADAGKLPYIRTLGGHRRFLASAVWEALRGVLPEEHDVAVNGNATTHVAPRAVTGA
jgi:excisionase family DNA binding protein